MIDGQKIRVQPPVPVGYIDGSLDRDGLEEEGLHEYLEHLEEARAKTDRRGKFKGKFSKQGNKLSTSTENKESPSQESEGIVCAKSGNALRLKELLDSGWETSTLDKHGSNALHWAAGAGHINILELLISYGLSINSANRCKAPAATLAKHGIAYTNAARLERRTGRNALHWAARNGMVDACSWLASRGADVHATTKVRTGSHLPVEPMTQRTTGTTHTDTRIFVSSKLP